MLEVRLGHVLANTDNVVLLALDQYGAAVSLLQGPGHPVNVGSRDEGVVASLVVLLILYRRPAKSQDLLAFSHRRSGLLQVLAVNG